MCPLNINKKSSYELFSTVTFAVTFADFPVDSMKSFFVRRFRNYSSPLSYDRIIEESFDETPFLERDYRKALKELEKEGKIAVHRITSRTKRGLSGLDQIVFS